MPSHDSVSVQLHREERSRNQLMWNRAEWRIWAHHLAPIYLRGRLPDEDFAEFLNLIQAFLALNQRTIKEDEVAVVDAR